MKSIALILLVASVFSLTPASGNNAPSVTYTLQPGPANGKDIWTTSYYSYANCSQPGPGGGLANDLLRIGGWDDLYYSLLQFDLTGLPTNATSAILYLYCNELDGGGTPMYLDRITQFWWDWQTAGTGCDHLRLWWADRPAATQWISGSIATPVSGQWYAIDITTLYNAWQNGTYPNYGLQLRPVNNSDNNFDQFYSSRSTNSLPLQPRLVITAPSGFVSQPVSSPLTKSYASQSPAGSTSPNGKFMCQGASPVAAMSGDYRTRVDDAALPCRGLPLQITRFYNSIEDYDGPFSIGWNFNQTVQLILTASTNNQQTALVRWANGVRKSFTLTNGVYQAPIHCYDTFSSNSTGFLLQTPKGLQLQFNAGGFLVWQQDRNGNRVTYNHDLQNRISQAISADGRTLTYSYGADNRVSRIQDWANRQWNYRYDGSDNLTGVQYPDGSSWSYAYDTNHFLIASFDQRSNLVTSLGYDPSSARATNYSDGAAISYSFAYNTASNTTTKTDSLGRPWSFQYNSYGNKQNFVSPAGYQVQLTWTANQDINSTTDPRGYPLFYTYDSRGNVLSTSNALGYVTQYTYETNFNQVTSITDPRSGFVTNAYDAHGNLTRSQDAGGFVQQFEYDQYGQLTNSIDARNYSTAMNYDNDGDLLSVTDPRGSTVTYSYDNRGNRLTMTDGRSNTWLYAYDVMDRVISVTNPLNNVTIYGYDASGNRVSVTDARTNTTHFVYDQYSRLVAVTNALGYTTTYQYDLYGNLVSTRDALGNVVSNSYDVINRLVKTVDPNGNATSYGYDQNNNRTNIVDALTNTTSYAFDPLNRTVSMTNALNGTWNYQYDANNNLLKVTDARNNPSTSLYDPRNMVTNSANALGYAYQYQYDGNDNPIQRTDPNGAVLNYTYDPGNLLTTVSYPNGSSLFFAYDANRNVTAISNSTETVQYAYDALNRVTNVFIVGLDKNVGYAYDGVGNRSAMIDPNGGRTTYQYDPLNRLTALTDPGSNVWVFGYDAINRLTNMAMPNGITCSYTYDSASRLTNLVYQTSSNVVLQSFAYTYDAVGNPLRAQREDNTYELYKYDKLYRVTRVDYDATNTVSSTNWTSYAYDAVGNRLNQTNTLGSNSVWNIYSYDFADRLLTNTSGSVTNILRWDKNGNLTNLLANGTNTWYSWDFENKLATITYQNGSNNTLSYYPSSSLRHTKTDSAGTNNYVYDGQNELQQLDSFGTLVAQYVYSLGIDSLLARSAAGVQQYYLRDMIGSVTAIADPGQTLLATYRYDVFGAVRRQAGAATNPYLFTARVLDQDSGLYYYRARYLSPSSGLFVSHDPRNIGTGYDYALQNPAKNIDPLGEATYPSENTFNNSLPVLSACEGTTTPQSRTPSSASSGFVLLPTVASLNISGESLTANVGFTGQALGQAESAALDLIDLAKGTSIGLVNSAYNKITGLFSFSQAAKEVVNTAPAKAQSDLNSDENNPDSQNFNVTSERFLYQDMIQDPSKKLVPPAIDVISP